MATEETTITELELAEEVLADMVIPVDTSTDTKSVSLKQLRAWLGSSLPTGFILPAVGRIDDERFSLLDGKTLSKQGTYGAFCAKVEEQVQASNWYACTEEEYNADLLAYGQCGKFVIGTDYVRIPTITRFIGATITLSEIGKTYKESLPNIRGSFLNLYEANGVNGDFKYTDKQGTPTAVGGGYTTKFVEIDNPTYQDGAKVQPDHTKYPYYMVISTEGQTANVEIDINKVYEDLNLKATTDLSNVSSVASSFKEQSVGWGIPDYSAGVSLTISTTEILVDFKGVLTTSTKVSSFAPDVYINGVFVNAVGGTQVTGASGYYLVDVGDRVKLNSGSLNATLFPLKGVN